MKRETLHLIHELIAEAKRTPATMYGLEGSPFRVGDEVAAIANRLEIALMLDEDVDAIERNQT